MTAIRVAIADDSAFIRKAVARILDADPRLTVVGAATCGEDLLDHLVEWSPDVISLDLSMPGIGGLRTLDLIMEQKPTPVIILSTHAREDTPMTIEALHRGAVDFIDKQRYSLVDFQTLSRVLTEKILEIGGKKGNFVPPTVSKPNQELAAEATAIPAAEPAVAAGRCLAHDLLIIAASTGGPTAIQTVLESFGGKPAVPVVLIQHMPPDFTGAFAERLNNHLPFAVRHASNGEPLLAGTAYVAPGGYQLRFQKPQSGLAAIVTEDSTGQSHSPSADVTFGSAAETLGSRVLAAVLTGMGRDGADGIAQLTRLGAHAVAQDRESSIVFGMPRAAIEYGGVTDVLPLADIGPRLSQLLHAGEADPGASESLRTG